MKIRRRLSFFLSIFVLTLIAYSSCSYAIEDKKVAVVKIGFILPLTGEWAFLGNGIRDAALLAAEDEAGSVKLYFEDNKGELAASAVAAKKLTNNDHVQAVVSIISGVGKVIAPITSAAKVLHVGICSDTSVADGKYSFVNYLTAAQGAKAFLKHLEKTPQRRVGIFVVQEAGFLNIADEIKRQADTSSMTLAFTESFAPGTRDFRAIIGRAMQSKPELILLLAISPEIDLIESQLRELKVTSPLASIEALGLIKDRSKFKGSWYVDSANADGVFIKRYLDRYHHELTPGVGHAYDTIRVISSAIKHAPQQDLGMAAEAIRGGAYQGVVGTLDVGADGVFKTLPTIKRINDAGVPELIEAAR